MDEKEITIEELKQENKILQTKYDEVCKLCEISELYKYELNNLIDTIKLGKQKTLSTEELKELSNHIEKITDPVNRRETKKINFQEKYLRTCKLLKEVKQFGITSQDLESYKKLIKLRTKLKVDDFQEIIDRIIKI